jgi:hypothetical protein
MKMEAEKRWYLTSLHPEDGSSMDLQNTDISPHHYLAITTQKTTT